jgi:hypothetical protein
VTQQDWRRRKLIPAGKGGWTVFDVRDVARLRLVRALIDAGIPVGAAMKDLTDSFLDTMQSALLDALRGGDEQQFFAVVAQWPNGATREAICFSWDQVETLLSSLTDDGKRAYVFGTAKIINLTQFAREAAEKIADLNTNETVPASAETPKRRRKTEPVA